MAVNKVIKSNGDVLIDITDSTVDAMHMAEDYVAYDKSGARISGSLIAQAGTVITPSTTQQVVAVPAGRYTTGNVLVDVCNSNTGKFRVEGYDGSEWFTLYESDDPEVTFEYVTELYTVVERVLTNSDGDVLTTNGDDSMITRYRSGDFERFRISAF